MKLCSKLQWHYNLLFRTVLLVVGRGAWPCLTCLCFRWLCVPCFHVFCYLLCSKIAKLLQLATVYGHLPHQAGCNHGRGAESIFSDLNRSARLLWNSLTGDFSSLFMTLSGKLIVFNSCERQEKPRPLSLCKVAKHRIFRKGALNSEKSHHSRWNVLD